MSNSFYTHGSYPSTGSAATSASMRAELDLISAGFDKMPTLGSGYANQLVAINSSGTGLTTITTLPTLSVNDNAFTVQDNADNTRKFKFEASGISAGATRTFTMPDASTTLVGTDTTQTLSNKTLASPTITGTLSAADLTLTGNTTLGDASTDTLTVNATSTFNTATVIAGTDNTNAMLRITQLGTGNALLVEDSTNPDSTPFVIDANGKVVVGATSILATAPSLTPQLTVGGSTNATAAMGIGRFSNDASQTYLSFAKSRNTTIGTYGVAVQSGDSVGTILWSGDDGTAPISLASIASFVDGTVSTGIVPGRLVFNTTSSTGTLTQRMLIDSAGRVGIGVTPTAGRTFTIGGSMTGATGAYGSLTAPTVQPDVTANALISASQGATASNGGTPYTITNLVAYTASQGTFNADSTVTTQTGFNANSTLIGATNNYGFRGNIASGTGRWNLYMDGTANNYIAGSLGIGQTTLGQYNLRISKTITGALASYGVLTDGAVQSDVTTAGAYYGTSVSTQAAAFTLGNLRHYQAVQGTIGAGSIVSIQSGLLADATLTGATNNYGFLSSIAAPTSGITTTGTITSISSSTTTVTVNHDAITYTNGQTVTISATANATALTSGATCTILTVGTTDFTLIGAASNTVGVSFTATGAGTGTGTVTLNVQGSGKTVAGAASGSFTFTTTTSQTFAAVTVLTGSVTVSTRFNIYANGTASNYMAGSLGIGSTSVTNVSLRLSKNITGAVTSYGLYNDGTVQSDVTTTAYGYRTNLNTQAAAFTLGSLVHYGTLQGTIGAGSTVTNQYGFIASSDLTGATNNYGFYGNLASASNVWNLYMAGTADNYMAGALGIGSTSLTGYSLRVGKNITGSTASVGIASTGVVQSDSTSNAQGFRSAVGTAAASFTLPNLYQYASAQGTFGLGSTVTNQYGYFADSSLTGAANNYGFYGNIASGTGRYNFYAAGTATNYFGGNTIVEVTDNTNAALRITQLGTGNALLVEDSANPDSTPFVIDANGKVVVGATSAPTISGVPQFQVAGVATAASSQVGFSRWDNSASSSAIQFAKSRSGSIGTQGVVSSGDSMGQVQFYGDDGTTFVQGASIQAVVDGTPGTNDMPGRLVFSTTADGASTPTERMRIDSAGNVGIGATSIASTTKLQVQQASGNLIGYFNSTAASQNVRVRINSTDTASSVAYVWSYSDATLNKQASIYLTSTGGLATQVGQTAGAEPTTGTTAMVIDSSGNVGIGTSSPGALLHVSNASAKIRVGLTASDQYTDIYRDSPTGYTVYNAAQAATFRGHIWQLGGAEAARIDSSGNVGIGTSSPTDTGAYGKALDVQGSGGSAVYVRSTTTPSTNYGYIGFTGGAGNLDIWNNPAGNIRFYNNSSERMRIDSSGNVQVQAGAVMPYAPAPASISTTATLTNTNIQAQIINTTGTSYTVTMPLGTTLETLATWATTNVAYDFFVINTASGTITMAVNTGVTSLGGLTIATGVSAQFRIRRTAANTFVLYRLG